MSPHIIHLSKDKKLKKIIATHDVTLQKRKQVHLHIISSIVSQQLSTKVAAIIYKRFTALFPDKKNPAPADILAVPFDTLKAIGLSNSKTNYVRNVCEFFIEHNVTDLSLHKMDVETLINFLIQIKGIGRWTAEMILMFTLGREDVFAVDDLGIQQAMCKLYNIDASDKKMMQSEMLRISQKWSPYRTYACRYLWLWKDAPAT